MLDLVLRNATIVDGTGAPAVHGDVGVRDGRIAGLGPIGDRGRREIDVEGRVVAPGFVDVHTHYDAQVFWDPMLSPSPLHGVTTVVGGNCGLTLAPTSPDDEDFLVRLLSRVEAIPTRALRAGLELRWRSFAQYLDAVDALPIGPNVAFMVGHSALRRAVMGDAASAEAASGDQIAAMCALLGDALGAGGLGFTTATSPAHRDGDGRPTPPNFATDEEMIALAAVCSRYEGTSLEFTPASFFTGFTDEDAALMAAMSAAADRHLNWNTVLVNAATPDLHRRQLAACEVARRQGGWIVPMVIPHNFRTRFDLLDCAFGFSSIPEWTWFYDRDVAGRLAALRDPTARAELRATFEATTNSIGALLRGSLAELVVSDVARPGSEALVGRTIGEIAAERGASAFDALAEVAVANDLEVGFVRRAYRDGDAFEEEARAEVLRDPRVVLGASDGGAHVDSVVNVEYSTRSFAELVRERSIFTVEELVREFSDVPARLYGLRERGRLVDGYWADMVVFDPAVIDAAAVRVVDDLPAGEKRLYAGSVGVEHVLVAGVPIVAGGAPTGDTPGRLLRSGRDTSTVTARPADAGRH